MADATAEYGEYVRRYVALAPHTTWSRSPPCVGRHEADLHNPPNFRVLDVDSCVPERLANTCH
jgi:hypothetical protein